VQRQVTGIRGVFASIRMRCVRTCVRARVPVRVCVCRHGCACAGRGVRVHEWVWQRRQRDFSRRETGCACVRIGRGVEMLVTGSNYAWDTNLRISGFPARSPLLRPPLPKRSNMLPSKGDGGGESEWGINAQCFQEHG